jgi:hypothetical protein
MLANIWCCVLLLLQVHAYVSTGLASSKFGIRNTHLQVSLCCQAFARYQTCALVHTHSACIERRAG